MSTFSIHQSDECLAGDHGFCRNRCFALDCNDDCKCSCHVRAIDRQDVPQEDQFIGPSGGKT